MNMRIGFLRLIRVHMIIAWRQRSLWAAAVPLALFALLLGVISPAGPHDHGAGDLAFRGCLIVCVWDHLIERKRSW